MMENLWRIQFLVVRIRQWISGDRGVGLGVLGEFPGSGGMGCGVLSKARSPARGRGDGVMAHRTGLCWQRGGRGRDARD